MPITLPDSLVTANKNYKVADSKDLGYQNSGMDGVTDVKAGIDYIYDALTAVPKFWLISNTKVSSDGSSHVYITLGTKSQAGGTCKIIIQNLTSGESTTYNEPANGSHIIDLGIINTFGTYRYNVTAYDNYNNAMVVDVDKSSDGSYDQDLADRKVDQNILSFYIISGTVNMSIVSMKSNYILNGSDKLYSISRHASDNKYSLDHVSDIRCNVTVQYPDVTTTTLNVEQAFKCSIKSVKTYFKASLDEYYPAHKYFDTLKAIENNILLNDDNLSNVLPNLSDFSLYYRCANGSYVLVSDYDEAESNYTINTDDVSESIFYDFVKISNAGKYANDDVKFIYDDSIDKYRVAVDEELGNSNTLYVFIPAIKTLKFYDSKGNSANLHKIETESLNCTIPDVYFLNECKHTLEAITEIAKGNETDPSMTISKGFYPGNNFIKENEDIRTIADSFLDKNDKILPIDGELTFSFVPVSYHTGVKENINYVMELHYKKSIASETDTLIKTIIKNGCKNGQVSSWFIGKLTRGTGIYYLKLIPKSTDGTVTGSTYYLYLYYEDDNQKTSTYVNDDSLLAYFDAQDKSNEDATPDIWYPRATKAIEGTSEREEYMRDDIYIRLSGLNYQTNGWISYNKDSAKYDDKYIQPHLSFTGDSYGRCYRINSAMEEAPMTMLELINDIYDSASSRYGQASIEIMYRTRCVGEMKACVLSGRNEESNEYSDYTYSDSDIKSRSRASSGVTISHNKIIANTNTAYTTIPYVNNQWKHVVFVIDTKVTNTKATDDGVLYNPFPSIKIYIDGVLTSTTDLSNNTDNSLSDEEVNKLFKGAVQLVLNGHLNNNSIENCGESQIRLMRFYTKALSNNEVVDNFINSMYDDEQRQIYTIKNHKETNPIPIVYFVNNNIPEYNSRKKGVKNSNFNDMIKLTEKSETKTTAVNCTMYYTYPVWNPNSNTYDMILETYDNVDVYDQGTSTLQFPVKNFKVRMYKNTGTDIEAKNGAKKLKFLPPNMADEWVEDSVFTLKCDFMESGHLNNTPTAKFYHHVVRELIDNDAGTSNTEKYDLSERSYNYSQNESGTYYIDKNSDIQPITDPNYTGLKYSRSEVTRKAVASPSRSYFSFEEDDNGLMILTSERDISKVIYVVTYEENGITYDKVFKSEAAVSDGTRNMSNITKIKAVFDKTNRYYVRIYNTKTGVNEWEEYEPVKCIVSTEDYVDGYIETTAIVGSSGKLFIKNNTDQYGRILYKINKKYRDSVDGFPCIVYYTDTYQSYSTDLYNKSGMNLLGTMMWNLDKNAKQLGFTINPVFEDDYIEYLKSVYVQCKDFNISVNDENVSSLKETEFINKCITDNFTPTEYFTNLSEAYLTHIQNDKTFNVLDTIIGNKLLSFDNFNGSDAYEYDSVKITSKNLARLYAKYVDTNINWYEAYLRACKIANVEAEKEDNIDSKTDVDLYKSLFYKYENTELNICDYIPYWKLYANKDSNDQYNEIDETTWNSIWKNSMDAANYNNYEDEKLFGISKKNKINSLKWFEKQTTKLKFTYTDKDTNEPMEEKYDLYATVPSYTHKQRYVKDNDGNYIFDGKEYILADNSSTSQRYSISFDNYRTYITNDEVWNYKSGKSGEKEELNSILLRMPNQCAVSYEASTNVNCAAATFYDITESYEKTYNDDFLNKYYNDYFYDDIQGDEVNRYVYLRDKKSNVYSKISPSNTTKMRLTLDEFKTEILIHQGLSDLPLYNDEDAEIWSRDLFFVDKEKDSKGNETTLPGPYVFYIVNNDKKVLCTKEVLDSKISVFVKSDFIYDDGIHYISAAGNEVTTTDLSFIKDLRYKFNILLNSYSFIQSPKVDNKDTGNYVYNSDKDEYEKVEDGKGQYVIKSLKSFSILDKKSYVGDSSNGTDSDYYKYMKESFESRYSFIDEEDIFDHIGEHTSIKDKDEVTWTPLKRLIKWVVDTNTKEATTDKFKNEFTKHFDLTYTLTYYLQMILFGQADNAGKNSMWDTWDGKKFYIRPYDMDTQVGLNNKGLYIIPTSAEINDDQSPTGITGTSIRTADYSNRIDSSNHSRYTSYTTTESRFWNVFAIAFAKEIKSAYTTLRNSGMYTKDYIMNYYKAHSTDIIGEKYYNADMNQKYLAGSKDYIGLLMGNRLDQFTTWIEERIIFCDTLFEYNTNNTLNTQLELRTEVIGTLSIGISVMSPQYVKLVVGTDDTKISAFIDTDSTYTYNGETHEGVLFTFYSAGNNKEVSVYGGGNIKEIYNLKSLVPSKIGFATAKRLTDIDLTNNDKLKDLNITNAEYLRNLNISNCTALTSAINASNCTNLQNVSINNSAVSGINLANGGNLKTFTAKNSKLTNLSFNNLQQLTNITITNDDLDNPVSSFNIEGCPLIKTLNFNSYNNLRELSINNCSGIDLISLEKLKDSNGNGLLKELSIANCDNLHTISLQESCGKFLENLDLSSVYGLDTLNIKSCGSTNEVINIRLPFYASKELSQSSNVDNKYSNRWHKLKYLLCSNSKLKSIVYGSTEDVTNNYTIDLSQLDSLINPSFLSCTNIVNINGLRSVSSPISFQNDTNLENITNSSMYYTSGDCSEKFKSDSKLTDISTSNIDIQSKLSSGTGIKFTSLLYSAKQSNDLCKNLLSGAIPFNKFESTTSIDTDNIRDYFVRDMLPRYRAIKLTTTDRYVLGYYKNENGNYYFDNDTKTFVSTRPTNPLIYSDKEVKYSLGYIEKFKYDDMFNNEGSIKSGEYDKNLVTYFKVGTNKYVVADTFGLFGYTEKFVSTSDKYYVDLNNVSYGMARDDNETEILSKYSDGDIIKYPPTSAGYSSNKYVKYVNGNIKTITNFYTFYNDNTIGLFINTKDGIINMPGGINDSSNAEYNYNNREYENYMDNANGSYDGNSLDYSDISTRYFRRYNPSTDTGKTVYKKNYCSTASKSYISDLSQAFRDPSNLSTDVIRPDIIFDFKDSSGNYVGFDKLTVFSHAFYNNSKLYNGSDITICSKISDIIKEMKSITTMYSTFAYTGIQYLKSDIFSNMTNLSTLKGMFRASKFKKFINSRGESDFANIFSYTLNSDLDTAYMFANSDIQLTSKTDTEGNAELNILLNSGNKISDATFMFANCYGIYAMSNAPLVNMTNCTDISSMFYNCSNMKIDNLSEFTLGNTSIQYPCIRAAATFAGCVSITGNIGKDFFSGFNNIITIGPDINYESHTHDSSTRLSIPSGMFTNTKIERFHKDFLSPLINLVDASSLFSKFTSSNNVMNIYSDTNYNNSLVLSLCGYTDDSNNYPGIPEDLFKNNKKLKYVSFMFAGNKNMWGNKKYSDIAETINNETICQYDSGNHNMPNIFRYTPNIEYAIGTFMGTTLHEKDLTYDNTNNILKIYKDYRYYAAKLKDLGDAEFDKYMVAFNSDTFFKYWDETDSEYKPLNKLISIRSIFENSEYVPAYYYGENEHNLAITSDLLSGLTSLTDVSSMFKNNTRIKNELDSEYAVPIDLFDSCRNTLKTTSNMFQGCSSLNGKLPTGDNCWLIAYNNYLNNIKNDTSLHFTITENVDNLFDLLSTPNHKYINYKIDGGVDENGEPINKILSFSEFRNRFSTLYTDYSNYNITYSNHNININKSSDRGLFVNDKYSTNNQNNSSLQSLPVTIKDIYLKDRYVKKIDESDIGKYYVNSNGLPVLMSYNVYNSNKGKSLTLLTDGSTLGDYSYNTTTNVFEKFNSLQLTDDHSSEANKDGVLVVTRYIKKSFALGTIFESSYSFNDISENKDIISTKNDSEIDYSTAKKNILFEKLDFLKLVIDSDKIINNEIIVDDNFKNFVTSLNDPLFDSNNKTSIIITPEFCGAVISGQYIEPIESVVDYGDSSVYTYITSHNPIRLISNDQKYDPGLLGSCKNLETTKSMFEGCTNLYGAVPKDIFSSESEQTKFTKLKNISKMFRSCVNLGLQNLDVEVSNNSSGLVNNGIDYTQVDRNPNEMYSRDITENSDYTLINGNNIPADSKDDVENNYLIPTDWLKNTSNLTNVSYLFTGIATKYITGLKDLVPSSTKVRNGGGLCIPSSLFSTNKNITNASYLFYGSPLLRGNVGNSFLRESLSVLQNIRGAFGFTSINSIGTSTLCIFESNATNNKLNNIAGLFVGCKSLETTEGLFPKFLSSKFRSIKLNDPTTYFVFSDTSINFGTLKSTYADLITVNGKGRSNNSANTFGYDLGNETRYSYYITYSTVNNYISNLLYDDNDIEVKISNILLNTSNK